ncbi:hypothetical protein Tco_0519794 [Tanacetum coccineum]
MSSYNHFGCSWCGGPFNGVGNGKCLDVAVLDTEMSFVYDLNPYSYNETTNFFNQPPQHQYETYSCEFCGGNPLPGALIVKHGTHPSMTRVPVTIKTLVLTNLHFIHQVSHNSSTVVRFVEVPIIALIVKPTSLSMSLLLVTIMTFLCFDQPPHYHIDQSHPQDSDFYSHFKLLQMEIDRRFEEMLRPLKLIPLVGVGAPERSDYYTEVTLDKEQCLCDHYTAHVTPPAYTPSLPFLAIMEPIDTLLMGE